MTKKKDEFSDPLIDEVRARRQALVRKYGGLRGWGKHLQKLQRMHPERIVSRAGQPVDSDK